MIDTILRWFSLYQRWLFWGILVLLLPRDAQAQPAEENSPPAETQQHCESLFHKKKAYLQASNCFESLAQKLKKEASSSETKRILCGRMLRNAVTSLRKAAQQTTKIEEAAYLRSRAIELLQQYLDQRLYEVEYRRKSARA